MTADGSRAITIYIAVPNPDRALKGGMFAQGELTLDTTAARAGRAATRGARRGGRGLRLHAARRQDRAHAGHGRRSGAGRQPSSKCAKAWRQAIASSSRLGEIKAGASAVVRGEARRRAESRR